MPASRRISSPLSYLAIAAVAAIVTGCASTPQNGSPQALSTSTASAATAPSAGSPASASKLIAAADLTKKAQDEGWAPEVRDGNLIYCKDEIPIGSRLPQRTCLDKLSVVQMMLAEQKQREQMQRAAAAAGMNGN